jgi:Cu(I)/Ag(I) efflux system membrane fusion protein
MPVDTPVIHKGEGTVIGVNNEAKTITLRHAPIASLNWPAMTMDFVAADTGLLSSIETGASVTFEFHEGQPGEWVITSIAENQTSAAPHTDH